MPGIKMCNSNSWVERKDITRKDATRMHLQAQYRTKKTCWGYVRVSVCMHVGKYGSNIIWTNCHSEQICSINRISMIR